MGLGGDRSFATALKSSLYNSQEAGRALLWEFKIRAGVVKMRPQLPDYDDFQPFDLSGEAALSAISGRVFAVFARPT